MGEEIGRKENKEVTPLLPESECINSKQVLKFTSGLPEQFLKQTKQIFEE
jgi:hypothetical protein